MSDKLYKSLGSVSLGDLTKIYEFLENVVKNLWRIDNSPGYEELHCNLNLEPGTDVIVMKYGKQPFFTIKGQSLKQLFDDWNNIQLSVEKQLNGHKPLNDFPLISLCTSHIFRHKDVKRGASINMGLMNVSDSATLFWKDGKLVDTVQYEIGEGVLMRVREEHSVTINDSPSFNKPRAVLMWTMEEDYQDIKLNDFTKYKN
jgi:hypothetical protein